MTSKPYQDFLKKCSNPYLDFMNECREKAKSFSSEELANCQTHHIVPRHHYSFSDPLPQRGRVGRSES